MSLAAFINKPSDAFMVYILLGCSLFFLWVLFRGAKISDADAPPESDEAEEDEADADTREGKLEPGCQFVAKGYAVTVVLIALGMALVAAFQALHPGH